jgi:O-antigen/teichoic acid export membrane protein
MTEIIDHSKDTKRIAKNTMMLYVQMFFSMLVSLYTSRVLLNALGVSDFGTYNVVGGLVAMFSLISGILTGSVSRFITYELGKGGDAKNVRRIFSTSLLIHIGLAFVVIIAMETIGVWFLNAKMVIAPDRLTAANWVFQGSIVSFTFGVLGVPYNATIIAYEKMGAFAYINILQVMLNLANVLFIAYAPWHIDRLICYALLTVGVSVLVQVSYMTYCRRNFNECKSLRLEWNCKIWKEIASYSIWNFIGSIASRLKWDGVNILLNLFFGTVVNAARGIAGSVNGAITAFANNFMTAMNPQITKSYAAGEKQYMYSLIKTGARYSYYIMFVLVLPIIFEMKYILTLWLRHYPEHADTFTSLALILSLCDSLANPLITAQLATGKVKNFQLVVGGFVMLNFPLSYLFLKLGFMPEVVFIIAIIVSLLSLYIRLVFLKHDIDISILDFMFNVCGKIIVVSILSSIVPAFITCFMDDGIVRCLIIILASLFSSFLSIYFVGCSHNERQFIASKCSMAKDNILKKIKY